MQQQKHVHKKKEEEEEERQSNNKLTSTVRDSSLSSSENILRDCSTGRKNARFSCRYLQYWNQIKEYKNTKKVHHLLIEKQTNQKIK